MKQWVSYIVIAALVICLILSLTNRREVLIETHTTDTINIVRIDTVRDTIPHFISEKVLDTIFIEKVPENGLKLPITQRYYNTDSYQAWVSGYRPNLDSINVFNKVVTHTVNHTITKEIYPKTVDWYLNIGSMFIDKNVAPYLGINVKFKNNIIVGANAGVYDKEMFYGFNVGFKLDE